MKKAALVLTTIHDPVSLEGYFQNFHAYGRLDQTTVYVIPDRRTPRATYARCAELRRRGLAVVCPDVDEQCAFLRSFGMHDALIPFDSDNRRNVGYLMAIAGGADFVISIDDDNYCLAGADVLAEHAVVCAEADEHETVATSNGWFNACELLDIRPPIPVYPRGFPYGARGGSAQMQRTRKRGRVRMNEGLWLGAPDLDGVTWLAVPAAATGFRGGSVVLDAGTWAPVNTQNTAFHRDVVSSAYFIRMDPSAGPAVDRYGDIFAGYFMQACAQSLGDRLRFGTPIGEHRRNAHHYLRDLTSELGCIWILEDLVPWLREVRLDGSTYPDAYLSLSNALEDAVERFEGFIWTDATRAYFHRIAYCMRQWASTCARI